MIYAYSDTHYDHKMINFHCHRQPDWQEKFLELHRKIVGPKDTVLFLGDLGFGTVARMKEILDSLTFKEFIAVLGNHDKSTQWLLDSGVDVVLNEHGQTIILDDEDYPIEVVLVAKANDPRTRLWKHGNKPVVAISHEPYENMQWPYLRGHTHNNPIPWGYDDRPYNLHRGMGRNLSVEAINYTPVPLPFLVGDENWIRKNYVRYYKHLFDYEAKLQRKDIRKEV